VIHSCIDLDRFTRPTAPDKIRAELDIGRDAPVIGLIGRVSHDKGHLVLLEAIPAVLEEFSDAVFVFAGPVGGMGGVMRDAVRGKGLEKSVRLLGFREDILDITAALDVSVLPSLGTDSSPAVLKEALFLGKPVVASRIAGLPEIVSDDSGILVAPGDAGELARAIITTLRQRGKSSAPARQFPEQFTPGFMCEAYLKVYDEMRSRSSARGGAS
jgi:glycosyltransferase involved in cell wall biosynthesis